MRGIIALDIDHTLTPFTTSVSPDVVAYLARLAEKGWLIAVISGRTLAFCEVITQTFPFEYLLAAYNGAVLLHMPSRRVVTQHYLTKSILPQAEALVSETLDFVVYGGYEGNDLCYYRPHRFNEEQLAYFVHRRESHSEIWDTVERWEDLPIDRFPSIKFFGPPAVLQPLGQLLERELKLHVPVIGDPFKSKTHIGQATQGTVHKGGALQDIKRFYPTNGPIIAAGDDYNDLPMLTAADIRVIMCTAPKDLLAMAHVVAPSAKEDGLITGLEQVMKELGG